MAKNESCISVLPTLLTPDETVEKLSISKATLYRLVETRAVPFYKVGRSLRFSEEDLFTYLADHRVEQIR